MRKNKKSVTLKTTKKTPLRHKQNTVSLYRKSIDYLTLRLKENSVFLKNIAWLVENNNTKHLDHGFTIKYISNVYGDRLRRFDILSETWEMLAQLRLRNPAKTPPPVEFKSEFHDKPIFINLPTPNEPQVFTEIEFVWLFFLAYSDYLPYFLELLEFNPTAQKTVSRIDYCFDICWIDCHSFLKKYFTNFKEVRTHKVDGRDTWQMIKTDRIELATYNKLLDIIENGKLKIVSEWLNPYQRYFDPWKPITRIEYRKNAKSCKELPDSSLNGILAVIESHACDYVNDNFKIDFRELSWTKKYIPVNQTVESYDRNTDPLIASKVKERLYRSSKMAESCLKSYSELTSKEEMFNELYSKYWTELLLHGFRIFNESSIPAHASTIWELQNIFSLPEYSSNLQ